MYMHVYMHDLRARDLPFLNGINPFKGSLHHGGARGLRCTGIPHICPRYMGKGSEMTDRDEGLHAACPFLPSWSNVTTPFMSLKPSLLMAHRYFCVVLRL